MRLAGWVVAMALLVGVGAGAQEEAPAKPEVEPIAASQIAVERDRVARRVRALERLAEPATVVQTIEAELPAVEQAIDQQEKRASDWMGEGATLSGLDGAEQAWLELQRELPGWLTALTRRIDEIGQAIREIDRRREQWSITEEKLREDEAPESVVAGAREVGKRLVEARSELSRYRGHLLTLQTGVAEQENRVERSLDDIASKRVGLVGRIFERDRPPLWRAEAWQSASDGFLEEARRAERESAERVRAFAAESTGPMAAHVLLLVLLFWALRSARARVRQRTEEERGLGRVADAFEAPHAMALVLGLTASLWIYDYLPPVILQLLFAVLLLPAVALLRRFTPAEFKPLLNALVAFYLIDRVRDLVAPLPMVVRGLFVVEMLAASALLAWLLRPSRLRALPAYADRSVLYFVGLAARGALILMLGALGAEILGYSRFGELVGGAVLESAYVGVVLYAAVRIFDSLVTLALRLPPLDALGMVKRSRYAMTRRIHRFTVVVAVVVWGHQTLDLFAVRQPVVDGVYAFFTASLGVGSIHLSLGDVVAFAFTVWLAFALSKFLRFALEEDVYPRLQLARGVPYAASTFVHYTVLAVGFFMAVAATGMDLNRFALLAGAFGVGIGFGLQNVVDNFVSGLILLTERPVKVGDTIETSDGLLGEVQRIGIRSSTVRTWTGAELILPNGQLISERVTNWTLSDRVRRLEVGVGVAYGSDVPGVLELLRGVGVDHPDVMNEPEPYALFLGFGDSSLDFELRGYTAEFDRYLRVRSELNVEINRRLAEAGFEIPFPQRDLHVRSVDVEVGRELRGDG